MLDASVEHDAVDNLVHEVVRGVLTFAECPGLVELLLEVTQHLFVVLVRQGESDTPDVQVSDTVAQKMRTGREVVSKVLGRRVIIDESDRS